MWQWTGTFLSVLRKQVIFTPVNNPYGQFSETQFFFLLDFWHVIFLLLFSSTRLRHYITERLNSSFRVKCLYLQNPIRYSM